MTAVFNVLLLYKSNTFVASAVSCNQRYRLGLGGDVRDAVDSLVLLTLILNTCRLHCLFQGRSVALGLSSAGWKWRELTEQVLRPTECRRTVASWFLTIPLYFQPLSVWVKCMLYSVGAQNALLESRTVCWVLDFWDSSEWQDFQEILGAMGFLQQTAYKSK